MYIGRKILFHDTVSSTNDLAAELLASGEAGDGTIVQAGEQQKGRGQAGNRWEAEPVKNLTMSLILRPHYLSPDKQFLISKMVSLAIVDLLKEYTANISIKWPNDIYVGGDKIAGILIEHSISGNIIDSTIAGVGLNINQVDFSPDIPNPVSLKMVTGFNHPVKQVLKQLCTHLNYWNTHLVDGDYSTIDNEYHSLLYRLDTLSTYICNGLRVNGTITGVDGCGRLLLRDEGGAIKRYGFREISFTQ